MNNPHKIMFIDIETVPQAASLEELPEVFQSLWGDKFGLLQKRMPEKYGADTTPAEGFASSAGIYAEFGKIICICVGYIQLKDGEMFLRTKSLADKDEKKLLVDFLEIVNRFFTSNEHNFCGHNIKEFDIPYICRRMLIHGIQLPKSLQIHTKKPWEVNLIDTMDFWKFGDYKSFTSLKLLTAVLGIPTPKDDIDGSQVTNIFYKTDDLPRIAAYCQKDVVATTQVWLKLNSLPTIAANNIVHT